MVISSEQPAVNQAREIGGVSRPNRHPPFSVKQCPQQLVKRHVPLLPLSGRTLRVYPRTKHLRAPGLVHAPHCDEWVGADRWRSEFINFVPPNPAVSLEQPSDSLLLR